MAPLEVVGVVEARVELGAVEAAVVPVEGTVEPLLVTALVTVEELMPELAAAPPAMGVPL
jgi:hypothetical protein